MNSELLIKIAESIEQYPERYNQSVWLDVPREVRATHTNRSMERPNVEQVRTGQFTCGATACVAGHAVVMSDVDLTPFTRYGEVDIDMAGQNALDIDSDLAFWLFSNYRREATMPAVLRAIAAGETDIHVLERIEHPHWYLLADEYDEYNDNDDD